MTDDDVLSLVRTLIKSVWGLEVLLLLRRDSQRSWALDEMVRELRSSEMAVGEGLSTLQSAGFIAVDGESRYRYQPASVDLDRISARVEALYATKPLAVAKAIMTAPNDKLRIFADAFKMKDS